MKDGKFVTVRLDSPDGAAVINARRLPLNRSLELSELLQKQKAARDANDALPVSDVRRLYELLASAVVSVEGIENEEGKALTADDIRALNVSAETLLAINAAVSAALYPAEAKDEKNSGGGDSSAA